MLERAIYLLIYFMLSYVEASITTDGSDDYFYGAIVTFNYTVKGQNHSQGSETFNDEIGSYGAHSPIRSAYGEVVRSLDSNTGITDGCTFHYNSAPKTNPWIALVSRGNCSFATKIDNAKNANASAVIVYDYKNSQDKTIMSHENSQDIVSVIIRHNLAQSIAKEIDKNITVTVYIWPGKRRAQQHSKLQKTSVIFVGVSFMILMLVSLAWLVFYYIQRFRIVQAHNRGQRQRQSLTRKAIAKLETRTLKPGDQCLDGEALCAVCIENYKLNDFIRKLPCAHIYHKKCIDPWLESKQTCPMCKINVIKTLCADDVSGAENDASLSEATYSNPVDLELSEMTDSTEVEPNPAEGHQEPQSSSAGPSEQQQQDSTRGNPVATEKV